MKVILCAIHLEIYYLFQEEKILHYRIFVTKRKDENGEFGYFNGSFSEIEIAENNTERFKKNILERGLKLLGFLEKYR